MEPPVAVDPPVATDPPVAVEPPLAVEPPAPVGPPLLDEQAAIRRLEKTLARANVAMFIGGPPSLLSPERRL
jgi:hypothetical protein